MDLILVPINLGNQHWLLASVHPKKRHVGVYDSLGARHDSEVQARIKADLESWVLEEAVAKGMEGTAGKRSDWTKKTYSVPRQHDTSSCGVLVCAIAERLAAGMDPADLECCMVTRDPEEVMGLRLGVAADILSGSLPAKSRSA